MIGNAQSSCMLVFSSYISDTTSATFIMLLPFRLVPGCKGLKQLIQLNVCTSAVFSLKRPGLNLIPVVVGTMRDRSCSSELIG